MDITALFDDADTAEHALVNLQALGIFPTRYKIKALHIQEETNAGRRAVYGNIFDITNSAFGGGEPPNREVQLLVTVADTEAHRAQSALISNHGRRVRISTP